jgi:hypothetical protein
MATAHSTLNSHIDGLAADLMQQFSHTCRKSCSSLANKDYREALTVILWLMIRNHHRTILSPLIATYS